MAASAQRRFRSKGRGEEWRKGTERGWGVSAAKMWKKGMWGAHDTIKQQFLQKGSHVWKGKLK